MLGTLVNIPVVLNQVNKIRIALAIGEGLLQELPQGIPREPTMCVIARALSNGWKATVADEITMTNDKLNDSFDWDTAVDTLQRFGFDAHKESYERRCAIEIKVTPEMCELMEFFDNGSLPHLILEAD